MPSVVSDVMYASQSICDVTYSILSYNFGVQGAEPSQIVSLDSTTGALVIAIGLDRSIMPEIEYTVTIQSTINVSGEISRYPFQF